MKAEVAACLVATIAANRLTQVAQGATVLAFGYGAAGRRTSVTLRNGVVGTFGFVAAGERISVAYAKLNQLVATSVGAGSFYTGGGEGTIGVGDGHFFVTARVGFGVGFGMATEAFSRAAGYYARAFDRLFDVSELGFTPVVGGNSILICGAYGRS